MIRALVTILFLLVNTIVFSQMHIVSTVNATGGAFGNNSLSFDWSVGEMTQVHSVFLPGLVSTFGVIQPPAVLFGHVQDFPSGYIRVTPNVTSNMVQLISQLPGAGNLEILVTDVLGRVMQKSKVGQSAGNSTQYIFMSMWACGQYFIQVRYTGSSGEDYQSVFKILKL